MHPFCIFKKLFVQYTLFYVLYFEVAIHMERASQLLLVVKNLPANSGDIRDVGSIPDSRWSPGGGHGNPLQYSCVENSMDRGAWRATVCRVTLSQTWLSEHVCTHTCGACPIIINIQWSRSLQNVILIDSESFIIWTDTNNYFGPGAKYIGDPEKMLCDQHVYKLGCYEILYKGPQ